MKSSLEKIKRYGVWGFFYNRLLHALSTIGIHIDPYYLIVKECSASTIPHDESVVFRELTYDDFVSYGNPEWFNASKLAVVSDSFNTPGLKAYGCIIDGKLACSGWVSTSCFAMPYPGFPSLRDTDAYLFDAYVDPIFRGHRLHAKLNINRERVALNQGRTRMLSFVSVWNRASLRSWHRIGYFNEQCFMYIRVGSWSKLTLKY